ncbi:uncharacterized protein LOC134244016 [Saccostrea cucullata]|uniref:uncharacterized protein LOC134244016 n=1 Tax=Saccostrea cuccullata TaxID=36930 RepID=UPI002ED0EC92
MSRKSLITSKRPPSNAFKSPLQKTQQKSKTEELNKPCEDDVQELEKKLQEINAEICELEKSSETAMIPESSLLPVLEGVRTKDLYPRYNLQLDD